VKQKMRTVPKKHRTLLKNTAAECPVLMFKLLIECWNAKTPHFGGDMPHRYDGTSKECAYCNRPKDWAPYNSGFLASQLEQETK
jgi:hypothetical protein